MPFAFFSRNDPVRVQPFFGYRTANRLCLTARAIKGREPAFVKRSFWRDFATMVALYSAKEVPDLSVELEYRLSNGDVLLQKAKSGPDGYVRFDMPLEHSGDRGERTCWERALVRWRLENGEEHVEPAFILTPGKRTRIGVISDIDDTILETGITGNLRAIARNWKRVMAQMPSERIIVPGASAFFAALGGGAVSEHDNRSPIDPEAPKARVRPVFYVSSSPWSLFSYLVTFQRDRGLPLGPVMLRDWGFNRRTLGKEGHGTHKRDSLRRILKSFPDLQFALIGDDSQKDLSAFGAIVTEFPGRIAAVFIRAVSQEPLSQEEKDARALIQGANVPFWLGDDYEEAKSFLRNAGLDLEGGVKKLVKTASAGE